MSKPYKVISLPIEPIERRYSKQWDKWFCEAFERNHIPYEVVHGIEGQQPSPDKFLDPLGTFSWKFSQLDRTIQKIQDKNIRYVIFLHDGWMPGCEAFPYLRDLEGFDIKVAGWWHAGSYDPTDLLGLKGCNQWAEYSEIAWLNLSDAIFVGSNYHKTKLTTTRIYQDGYSKVHVTGNPVEDLRADLVTPRGRLVVWPHRLSDDKCPEIFALLASEPMFSGVEFVRSLDVYRNKQEYYNLLRQARVAVSTATHENFGISMVEAAMLGCYPLCPNGLAYLETMEVDALYDSYEELVDTLKVLMEGEPAPYHYPYADRYRQQTVTDRVASILQQLGEQP